MTTSKPITAPPGKDILSENGIDSLKVVEVAPNRKARAKTLFLVKKEGGEGVVKKRNSSLRSPQDTEGHNSN